MFLKISNFWVRYLIICQMTYLEQIYARLLNYLDDHYWRHDNEQILLQWFLSEADFYYAHLYLSLFSMLSSNFNVSSVKSLRKCSVLILNLILLSILFTYILIGGFLHNTFWLYTQSNLEYLILNIHWWSAGNSHFSFNELIF